MPTFDLNDILKPLPLPGPDDSFFPAADHVSGAALIGEQFFEWQKYATGFKDAGDFLVEHAIDRGSMQDWLVFPILTLYRQSIELAIKCLIHECLALSEPRSIWIERRAIGRSPMDAHNLERLWTEALVLMAVLQPPIIVDESLEHTGRLICELAELDPDAARFRYPVTKQGAPSLPERRIDLHHAKSIVEMIHGVLEGIGECALQQAAFEKEMRAEWGS